MYYHKTLKKVTTILHKIFVDNLYILFRILWIKPMNLSSQNMFSSKAAKLLSWGHWFTFVNILLALIVSSLYLFSDPFPTTFSGQLFLLLNWVGHISFLTFICFVLTIFPLISPLQYSKRHKKCLVWTE